MMLRSLFSRPPKKAGLKGWRAYVVGDVHGRLDLLDALLAQIGEDLRHRPARKGLIVFLGDLIDRGADSAGVVERVRTLALPGFRTVALAGNHEEVLLRILDGDASDIGGWLQYGGTDTLRSYGRDPELIEALPPAQQPAAIAEAIPPAHQAFYRSMADSLRFGDYLFVHAGIRPGVELDRQEVRDLRWIREPFLSDARDHGAIVVHGHTIADRVTTFSSRIGIDTGAYLSGRLTALAIEGTHRWFVDTVDGRWTARETARV